MNILQMGGDMANDQEESGIGGEGEFLICLAEKIKIKPFSSCKGCHHHHHHHPHPPQHILLAEMTNIVGVVDAVAKDVDLQQRLTSSVNQLEREFISFKPINQTIIAGNNIQTKR